MGVKYDVERKKWVASYYKRHPITRMPISLSRKNLASKAQALKVEKELVIQIEDKIRRSVLPTWGSHLKSFFESMKERDYALKTIHSYSTCLLAHTSCWNDRLIDQITPQEVRELIQEKVGHRSTSHQANLLKFIKAAFNFAVESGHLEKAPIPHMKFKKNEKIKQVLTEAQTKLLLETSKKMGSEWYPHWCMALYTGMRNGELYALTWDKVTFDKRQILVDSSWSNTDGFKCTKSGDDRIIEIAPTLMTILKELKVESFDTPFVLPRLRKWDKGEQARELRMFLMGLSLPPIRFHDLRATWATIMLSKGVEPIKVMMMGGWKDLKTMQIYIRKAGVNIQGATDALSLHDPSIKEGKVISLSK